MVKLTFPFRPGTHCFGLLAPDPGHLTDGIHFTQGVYQECRVPGPARPAERRSAFSPDPGAMYLHT